MDIFGYFENIKFTLGAEVLSSFCSCLGLIWQIPAISKNAERNEANKNLSVAKQKAE